MPLTSSVGRLRSIDCLRGAAALAVAFAHSMGLTNYERIGGELFKRTVHEVTTFGATGVPLFFVISGFCIHLGYARTAAATGSGEFRFGAFWRRRFWRLYPVYFLVLCGCLGGLAALYIAGSHSLLLEPYPDPKLKWMGLDFLSHAFMAHGLTRRFDLMGGNFPFWTLAREEYLYLLYPLILIASLRIRRVWIAVAMVALTAILNNTAVPYVLNERSAPALWIQWYLGAVAADAYCGRVRLPAALRTLWLVPIWMLAASYTYSRNLHTWSTLGWGMAYFTLVNACVQIEQQGRWPAGGVLGALSAIGVFSYSLYLLHYPSETALLSLSLRLGTPVTPMMFVLRSVALTTGACAAGFVLFRLVERRFVTAARLPRSRPVLTLGTVAS